MSKKAGDKAKDGLRKQLSKLGDAAQEPINAIRHAIDPLYVQSSVVADQVIDVMLDRTMQVCQDKMINGKLRPFSQAYTLDVCRLALDQKSMRKDLRLDDAYINEEDSEEPVHSVKDNISHELGMNQDPLKIAAYQNRNASGLSSKSMKRSTSRLSRGGKKLTGKLTTGRLRGSALDAMDRQGGSVEERTHSRSGRRKSRDSSASYQASLKGEPAAIATPAKTPKKGLKKSDSAKALAQAKKMLEWYQSQVQDVEEWRHVHGQAAMTDGTDVDAHIDRTRAIKCLLDEQDVDGKNAKAAKKLAELERARRLANTSPNREGEDREVAETDTGGYYIEDGRIHLITKPKNDKLPKVYQDGVKAAVTDWVPEDDMSAYSQEMGATADGRTAGTAGGAQALLGVGGGLLGQLARTATRLMPDPKAEAAAVAAKQRPGYAKAATIEFAGLKLPATEANKTFVEGMKAASAAENVLSGRRSTGMDKDELMRSGTLRSKGKGSAVANVRGVDTLDNMGLEENFDPKDGVNIYKWTGGFEQVPATEKGRPTREQLKYALLKKGKPYTKMGRDNKTQRMTKDKYLELTEGADLRKMREDYDKLTATMRESELGDTTTLNWGRAGTIRNAGAGGSEMPAESESELSSRQFSEQNTLKQRHQSIDSVRAGVKGAKKLLVDNLHFRNNSLAFGDTAPLAQTSRGAFGKGHFGSVGYKYSASPLNQESTLEFGTTGSRLATQRNSNGDILNANRSSSTARGAPWLPGLAATGMSQRSSVADAAARRTQQPFFFASRRESGPFGEKEDPKLAREKKRDKVSSIISTGGDALDEHAMSRILYGNPAPTQKNLIGVRSLKQTLVLPSKLPSIILDKLNSSRHGAMDDIGDSGPVKAREIQAVQPLAPLRKTSHTLGKAKTRLLED